MSVCLSWCDGCVGWERYVIHRYLSWQGWRRSPTATTTTTITSFLKFLFDLMNWNKCWTGTSTFGNTLLYYYVLCAKHQNWENCEYYKVLQPRPRFVCLPTHSRRRAIQKFSIAKFEFVCDSIVCGWRRSAIFLLCGGGWKFVGLNNAHFDYLQQHRH